MDTDQVKSKQDAIRFIQELISDFIENKEAWENIELPDYLESMQAWLADADDAVLDANKWELLCNALEAPKFYE
ncbi:DUF7660 family protein [Planococcus halocryophilus]|uniref:DUF7660 family protein n=1 Tax=Planococcus halocryophilus TaxID=1215089 RepID=UPI001F0DDF6D|nr:hypothetical protein [Planococcus halocryophilus]MCH4825902.1 hypothetical protein [Planococcus halocryophilus]